MATVTRTSEAAAHYEPLRDGPAGELTRLVAALHLAVGRLVTTTSGGRPEAAPGPVSGHLGIRSVRRKPGRGIVAVYGPEPPHRVDATLVTATIAEEALASRELPGLLAALQPGDWKGRWPGIVDAPVPGVKVQAFPDDPELPTLGAAVDVAVGSALRMTLGKVVAALPGTTTLALTSVEADVVRYRAGSRCVLRYRVTATTESSDPSAGGSGETERALIVFGKLYKQEKVARDAHHLAVRLWRLVGAGGPEHLPHPLAVVGDMGLVLSEAVGRGHGIPGRALLRPDAGTSGNEALRSAADALAWWHTADIDPGPRQPYTAATQCRRAQAHLDTLVTAAPRQWSGAFQRLGLELLAELGNAECDRPRFVHGAFRPNQLVFTDSSQAAITDIDDASAGDPAIDVGSFWAHLRFPGLHDTGADECSWRDKAIPMFTERYRRSMVSLGAAQSEVTAICRRASLFEMTSILRMAVHRSRHVSSSRPQEVVAVLAEAERCLTEYRA